MANASTIGFGLRRSIQLDKLQLHLVKLNTKSKQLLGVAFQKGDPCLHKMQVIKVTYKTQRLQTDDGGAGGTAGHNTCRRLLTGVFNGAFLYRCYRKTYFRKHIVAGQTTSVKTTTRSDEIEAFHNRQPVSRI